MIANVNSNSKLILTDKNIDINTLHKHSSRKSLFVNFNDYNNIFVNSRVNPTNGTDKIVSSLKIIIIEYMNDK